MTEAYCVKCKKKIEMEEEGQKEVVWKNGVSAMTGTCSICGTKVCKILGRK